jgi:two-component system KDP operon response regulator KdpE
MIVLITDTDREMIKELKLLFSLCEPDWQILVCYTAEQCLAAISHNPNLYILGMKLPDMSCVDLISKIRDNSDVPIVTVSNMSDESYLIAAFDAGVNDYIIKPLNKPLFMARLRAVLRRYRWDHSTKNDDFNCHSFSSLPGFKSFAVKEGKAEMNKNVILKYVR